VAADRPGAPDLVTLTEAVTQALAKYRQAEAHLFDTLAEQERRKR
jgi:hypothetical protein